MSCGTRNYGLPDCVYTGPNLPGKKQGYICTRVEMYKCTRDWKMKFEIEFSNQVSVLTSNDHESFPDIDQRLVYKLKDVIKILDL